MKYKYTLWENTPLKFYRFLCALLPISCAIGTLALCYTVVTTYVYYESPLFWFDISFRVLMLILVYMSCIFLRRKEWRGVQFFLLYLCIICIFELILDYLEDSTLGTYIGRILCTIVILTPVYVYFQKRRPLFYPSPFTIPTDKSTDGSNIEKSGAESPVEPKRPIFERCETYIACPGCGSLIPKGTKRCSCGYDLSGPASRAFRPLRHVAPVLLCLLLIIAGTSIGYYAGQESMNSELDKQFSLGYESGHNAGSKSGYSDGYNRGVELGTERTARDFGNYYQDGYYDAMDDIGLVSGYTPTYFNGLGSLHTRLAESFFLSPNRSKQEVAEILQASGSIKMPILSGSK